MVVRILCNKNIVMQLSYQNIVIVEIRKISQISCDISYQIPKYCVDPKNNAQGWLKTRMSEEVNIFYHMIIVVFVCPLIRWIALLIALMLLSYVG